MPQTTINFYKDLTPFSEVPNMLNESNYKNLPEDWFVVVTDVKGSTKAIETGHYKDVNVIGVSSIIAANNSCDGVDIPYIFGGDGATLFIPAEKIENVKRALSMTKKKSIDEFGLYLRVSIIPVADIYKNNSEIFIAKMKLSGSATMALAKGNGLALAENLTKKTDQYELTEELSYPDAHIGLECRWSPIKSANGEILTIIIQSVENDFNVYTELLNEIYKIVPNLGIIDIEKITMKFPPEPYFKEVQMKNEGFIKYIIYFFGLFYMALMSMMVATMKKKIVYLNELTKNTDHIKFDETLRMIIDVSIQQKNQLIALLSKYHKDKKIFYGLHFDQTALITCFVKSKTDHIHFVDGGSGGYALAAKQLKAMRSAALLTS